MGSIVSCDCRNPDDIESNKQLKHLKKCKFCKKIYSEVYEYCKNCSKHNVICTECNKNVKICRMCKCKCGKKICFDCSKISFTDKFDTKKCLICGEIEIIMDYLCDSCYFVKKIDI